MFDYLKTTNTDPAERLKCKKPGVRVLRLHLVLASAAQRLLSLLLHVRNRVEDAAALGRVSRRSRLRLEGHVLITAGSLRLQERLDHLLLVRTSRLFIVWHLPISKSDHIGNAHAFCNS